MKLILPATFLFLLYLSPLNLYAQQTAKINGIVNDGKETLPAATILLYTAKDSILVTTAMTDQNGIYSFTTANGKYYIVSSSIGYNKVKTPSFDLNGTMDFQVPPITLKENSKKLNEVSIVATKPVLERRADKLIFNIEATPSASGLTALEVLRKAPGVTIDHNENISLAGKSNVLVTIDGKQTYLSSTEVVNLLKSMQSNEIESIEIINNPGSKYDANSTGGIINIKTKKSKAEGFNGSVALTGGFNKHLLTNNSINLNYRKKDFNVFGSYGINRQEYNQELKIDRITPGTNPLYFKQRNKDTTINASQNFKIGSDFFLSKNHTIGFLVKGNISDYKGGSLSNVNIGKSFDVTDSVLITPSYTKSNRKNFSYNLNYKGVIDTAGQEISLDADYSTFDGSNNSNYINRFFLPDGTFFKNGQIYRNSTASNIDIKAIKADYVLPLNKKFKLDAGVKIANVKSDNNYIYENDIQGSWVFDDTKSNRFLYDESVSAAYATLNITMGKTSIQGGLRAEHTKSTGNSVTTNQLTEKEYTDLFPSLLVSQNFDADNNLNFSYSRKINRPNYQNLNPFIFFLDQYTYNQGNPNLKPEYSSNLQVSYLFKQKYSAALAYSHTSDVISQVLLQNEAKKSMYQTVLNLASENVLSLTLNFPVTLTKWWNMNNNLLGYFKQIKSPDLNGANLNSEQVSANIYLQNNFKINDLFSADAAFVFSTPQIEGAFKVKSIFTTDAGFRYNFPNKNGNLKLGISDIFHSQKAYIYSTLPGNIYNLEQAGTTRSARLTFTYRFGKMTVKSARNRSTGLDDEQKRLGSK
ncbi:outer membrane receptor protein involved in Fe transport [Pedobacter cryoconitis]|uniref:Outer membrane receptor protein involved in Fe transport n=1 Tax=Pedobacter cryoconitis TaxID=188932 RepID=A0A7W8ZMU6_9SPHI|nr:TonB-dependent receptor [Pedobacter cryoconitis]MBB5636918.1 outer membrane receptor protein involved in Fe transport [Pedobacter cryoconitis]